VLWHAAPEDVEAAELVVSVIVWDVELETNVLPDDVLLAGETKNPATHCAASGPVHGVVGSWPLFMAQHPPFPEGLGPQNHAPQLGVSEQ